MRFGVDRAWNIEGGEDTAHVHEAMYGARRIDVAADNFTQAADAHRIGALDTERVGDRGECSMHIQEASLHAVGVYVASNNIARVVDAPGDPGADPLGI